MTTAEMRDRLMDFAVDVYRLTRVMDRDFGARHVASQLFRASSSVAANYRATALARSSAEFVAKLGTVREEADEVVFWMEFMQRAALVSDDARLRRMRGEAGEIVAMVSAAYRTSKARYGKKLR